MIEAVGQIGTRRYEDAMYVGSIAVCLLEADSNKEGRNKRRLDARLQKGCHIHD